MHGFQGSRINIIYLGVIAFVMLKEGVVAEDQDIFDSLRNLVKAKIASFATPNTITKWLVNQ